MQLKKNTEQRSNGPDVDKINSMDVECATHDDENQDYLEDAADSESTIDEISQHMKTNMAVIDVGSLGAKFDGRLDASKAKLVQQNSVSPEVCHRLRVY